jgi:perosamine synthetase
MNELSAAIGRIQLQKLDLFNIVRRENTKYIYEHIFPEPLTSNRGLGYNPVDPEYYHVYFWAPVFSNTVHQMERFKKFLKEKKVGFRCRYTAPMYKQPIFKNKYAHIKCPKAESLCPKVIGLPNHQGMLKKDMEELVGILGEFFK